MLTVARAGECVELVKFYNYTTFAARLKGWGASRGRGMGASAAKPTVGARLEIGLDIIEMGKDFRALCQRPVWHCVRARCVRW